MIKVLAFGIPQRFLQGHVDRLTVRIVLIFTGTVLNTRRTPGAVFGSDLYRILHSGKVLALGIETLEGRRSVLGVFRIVGLDANRRMRADQ